MDMTIERLRAFRGIQREIEEIDREISLLYYPIASPRSSETHGTTPGDPTARAVSIIMKKQEDIEVLRAKLARNCRTSRTGSTRWTITNCGRSSGRIIYSATDGLAALRGS